MARVSSTPPDSTTEPAVVVDATDPDTQLSTDQTLTESENAIMDIFDRRATATASPPTDAESSPETVSPAVLDDGSASGSVPSSGDTEPEPLTDDVPAPDASATDSSASEGEQEPEHTAESDAPFTFAGITYPREQLETAVKVHQWFSNLDQSQIGQIDALMSGQYQLTPIGQTQPQGPAGQPTVDSTPDEWLDPQAKTEIDALRAEISQLRQSIVPVAQSQQDLTMQRVSAQIDSASRAFAQERGLTDAELNSLQSGVRDSQIFPTLVQRRNGDNELAMRDALDTLYWTTPEFRDRHVQSQVQAGIQELADSERSHRERQQQLTALSGAGGSAPRRDPVPTDRKSREKAMIEEISAGMNGNGQLT